MVWWVLNEPVTGQPHSCWAHTTLSTIILFFSRLWFTKGTNTQLFLGWAGSRWDVTPFSITQNSISSHHTVWLLLSIPLGALIMVDVECVMGGCSSPDYICRWPIQSSNVGSGQIDSVPSVKTRPATIWWLPKFFPETCKWVVTPEGQRWSPNITPGVGGSSCLEFASCKLIASVSHVHQWLLLCIFEIWTV